MVVVLKGIEELRKDRQVARSILVLDKPREWLQCHQAIKIVSWAQVEGLALLQTRNICDKTP